MGTDGATDTGSETTGAGGSSGTGDETASTTATASGGAATTSSGNTTTEGTTTSGAPSLPALVTSGPEDYWNTEGSVSEVTTAADLSVDEGTTFQRWDGFGGTFNEMGWDALSVVSSEIEYALTLLFDAEEGANFAYGRIPIGASDYSMSWYTLAETTNDYAMEDFSIARDQEMLIPFIKAAQEIKSDLRFFASPWVVPSWMMDSGRNMRSDAQTLEAHALYFAKFVEAYAVEGIEVEAIHTQNEPGYARVHWTHELFIDFIKSYLGPEFEESNVSAEIWCGTMSHPDDADIATTIANDPEAMEYVKGFGLQWNLQSTVATLAAKAPVMQTEHKCGNYNFESDYWDQSRYDPNKAQNDHLYGEESWQNIRDWVVAGVNSYIAWNMVLDTVGKSLDGWPQNALLVVDRAAQTLIVTPAYYTFRHFSQYIAPGATRIAISGSDDALAFKNPDGSVVTEVYNSGESAKTLAVAVSGGTYQFEVPAHGWATLRTTP
ncbi:MAG TPA: glycoside hydrolase family 30 protein [Polyangiaceae bacterium]